MKLKIITSIFVFAFSQLIFLEASFSAAPKKLALNWKAEPQFGGFYQAQMNGAPIEITEGGSGTPTIQMLVFGKTDMAIVSAEEILISNEKNPKNQVIALFATFQTNPQILMTRQERNIKNIQDLLSKEGIIAAQNGLTYVSFLKKKYPNSKVQWVPYLGGISGILKEKNYAQQGFLTSEPLLAEKAGIKTTSFLIADEGFNPYTTVVAVRKSDWEKNKKDYVTLMKNFESSWRAYAQNPKPTNEKMAKINKALDLQTFQKSAETQTPLLFGKGKSIGPMKELRWQQLINSLRDLRVIKSDLKAADQFVNP